MGLRAESMVDGVQRFSNVRAFVVGDVIVDAYFRGTVHRISPESPVPILDVEQREYRLGGAANVALNIKMLGAEPVLFSVVGFDDAGVILDDLLREFNLSSHGIVRSAERLTSMKTRLMSGHHQMLRFDEEQTDQISDNLSKELISMLLEALDKERPNVIVIEDYDKGVLSVDLIQTIIDAARKRQIPVIVDPKERNFFAYSGATLFKPNLRELKSGLGLASLSTKIESLIEAFALLNQRMPVDAVLFTLAEHGVFAANAHEHCHIQAIKRSIADVSGAGDSVVAVASLCLARKMSLHDIAYLSNLAGGWVCQYPGVVPITQNDLMNELTQHPG